MTFRTHDVLSTVLVEQWIERPPCVLWVMGSIPVRDSEVSLSNEYIYGKLNVKHKQEETSRTYKQYQTKYVLDNIRISCKTVSKQNAWIIVRSIYSLGG